MDRSACLNCNKTVKYWTATGTYVHVHTFDARCLPSSLHSHVAEPTRVRAHA